MGGTGIGTVEVVEDDDDVSWSPAQWHSKGRR